MKDLVPTPTSSPRRIRVLGTVLALAVALAHLGGLKGAFVLDDHRDILENPTIRSLAPDPMPFSERGVMGSRPLINLTFALNHALGGLAPLGYHVFNLAIHVLSALLVFGIVRRALQNEHVAPRFAARAAPLGLAVALLWGLHPLTTHAVTYVNQRCESLMGFFYLAVLFCAVRGWHSSRPRAWQAAAGVCLALGAGCKEVIVTAPFMVWLYDLIFESREPLGALRRSRVLYAGFLPGLGLLAVLALAGGTWGTNPTYPSISPWQHLLNQPEALWTYLRLTLWPHPLCFDYGWMFTAPAQAAPLALALAPLAGLTVWAVVRRWPVGYPAAWFFVILAPSSSLVPLKEYANEYRMYLPLAGLVALTVLGACELGLALARRAGEEGRDRVFALAGAAVLVLAAGGLAWTTVQRNRVYASEAEVWRDTVRIRPQSERGRYNLGTVLLRQGQLEEAREHLAAALALYPGRPETNNNLALVLSRLNRPAEALALFLEAARLQPDLAEARYNAGTILNMQGRPAEALPHFQALLEVNGQDPRIWNNLGQTLGLLGREPQALEAFDRAVRLSPGLVEARHNLGLSLERAGRLEEAAQQYREALRLMPGSADLAAKAGAVLVRLNRPQEAVPFLREAARLQPGNVQARLLLGGSLAALGRLDEAAAQYREVQRLKPGDPAAKEGLRKLGR